RRLLTSSYIFRLTPSTSTGLTSSSTRCTVIGGSHDDTSSAAALEAGPVTVTRSTGTVKRRALAEPVSRHARASSTVGRREWTTWPLSITGPHAGARLLHT